VSQSVQAASGQALARKWRPRSFDQMVGQEHVVRALTNALEQKRLHHAYLMTGTRGVGKTTLARVMAKALNCETGVSASPCGRCSACIEIDAGRFVDVIELDAASNTQVDQMRELLENALYAPTRARFKVYIIDEVHMLSRSAFNAMLKTLEEPPEHVKFILATTDPQKVPVTVLSRCLQFNLKQIPAQQIRDQFTRVLQQEQIAFESAALGLIARAAHGSMRDGLSLLDQAIAHGAGSVTESSVREMLGAIDQEYLYALLEALAGRDGPAMMAVATQMQERSLSLEAALQELAGLLHRLALLQTVPDAVPADEPDRDRLQALATRFAAEDLQLDYQIALQGRADLWLAPDEFAGFTMTLLRMLAFAPQEGGGSTRGATATQPHSNTQSAQPRSSTQAAQPQSDTRTARPRNVASALESDGATQSTQMQPGPAEVRGRHEAPPPGGSDRDRPEAMGSSPVPTSPAASGTLDWTQLLAELKIGGMARMLAQHSALSAWDGQVMHLQVPEMHRHLLEKPYRDKLRAALEEHFKRRVRVEFNLGQPTGQTPAELEDRARQVRQEAAVQAIDKDPFVRELVENFDARVVDDSIRPLGVDERRVADESIRSIGTGDASPGDPPAGQARASQAHMADESMHALRPAEARTVNESMRALGQRERQQATGERS
jgi:DNA polymerase III subunit gamma/tau